MSSLKKRFESLYLTVYAACVFAELNNMDYFIKKDIYEACDFGPDMWIEYEYLEKQVEELLAPIGLSLREVYSVFKSADRHHRSPALALQLMFNNLGKEN